MNVTAKNRERETVTNTGRVRERKKDRASACARERGTYVCEREKVLFVNDRLMNLTAPVCERERGRRIRSGNVQEKLSMACVTNEFVYMYMSYSNDSTYPSKIISRDR